MSKKSSSSHHKKLSKSLKKKRKDKERKKKISKQKEADKLLQRELTKQLQVVENFISNMPSSCTSCDREFDAKDEQHLDSWNLGMSEGVFTLVCDECGEKDV